jgi:hypothetical protein
LIEGSNPKPHLEELLKASDNVSIKIDSSQLEIMKELELKKTQIRGNQKKSEKTL